MGLITLIPSFLRHFNVLITSSDFNKLNDFDLPFACDAIRAHLIDKLLSPSISRFFLKGIDESLSIDNCTHSLFGASKLSADLYVQEFGKNLGLNTVCFRAGCITGNNHSGAKLHGFLSYLVKKSIREKSYQIIGYKGKQVRDNIHAKDLVNCFWNYYLNPKKGEVYNIGGGRFSNCSILEALNEIENLTNIKVKKQYSKSPRVGDHIWYITNNNKFKKDYPKWKQKYNTKKIIDELIQ